MILSQENSVLDITKGANHKKKFTNCVIYINQKLLHGKKFHKHSLSQDIDWKMIFLAHIIDTESVLTMENSYSMYQ